MPNEIPDSDDESDCEPGPHPQAGDNPLEEESVPSIGDRGLDVNFDDFISQTQSAKDGSSQLEQTKRSTASTQKHLRDALVDQRQSASSGYDGAGDFDQSNGQFQKATFLPGQRKRAFSELGDGHDQKVPTQNRTKRTKTYGASSRRITLSQSLEEPSQLQHMDQPASATHLPAKSSSQVPEAQDGEDDEEEEEDIVPRSRCRPNRIASLLGDSVSNAGHVLSMSNSSIGGYQSYNMDFRGSGSGLDINANPFGALSQVSVDASVEQTAEERRFDLSSTVPLSVTPQRPSRDAISPLTDAGSGPTSTSLDPSLLSYQLPEDSQMLTSPEATTTAQALASTIATAHSGEMGEAQMHVETVSEHTEEPATSNKRGNRSKVSRPPSVASTQDLIMDRQDDDEHAVGLPKEQYKPRPSKSRGGTIEAQEQIHHKEDEPPVKKKGRKKSLKSAPETTEHSSPTKLPTSELHLSDEAIIGLPKENYKPRPSRRRSRMIAEDDEASIEVDTGAANPEDFHNNRVQNSQPQHVEASEIVKVVEAPTPKPRKGRKAKVKRAKTYAADLLKKSEPMISDGEEDVVWMDTKPAKVKLNIPADPLAKNAVKEEDVTEQTITAEGEAPEKPVEAFHECSKTPNPARSTIVTVEIPARTEKEKPETKKRGRKAKALTISGDDEDEPRPNEATASAPATHPAAVSPPPPGMNSTVLQEKDTNTSLPPPTPQKPAELSSPTKTANITHSPINPSGGKVLYRVGLSRRSAIPPLLKIVKPPTKQQVEKQNFDEDGQPRDLVAETMKKWREMGVLD